MNWTVDLLVNVILFYVNFYYNINLYFYFHNNYIVILRLNFFIFIYANWYSRCAINRNSWDPDCFQVFTQTIKWYIMNSCVLGVVDQFNSHTTKPITPLDQLHLIPAGSTTSQDQPHHRTNHITGPTRSKDQPHQRNNHIKRPTISKYQPHQKTNHIKKRPTTSKDQPHHRSSHITGPTTSKDQPYQSTNHIAHPWCCG